MPVKVSVVMPVFNAMKHLDAGVASVLAQSMWGQDLELICVDDGSTDGSLQRLRDLERQHPGLRVIAIPASGWPGRPRNTGVAAARGEYVMFVDADDRLEPEAMQRMYDLGAVNDADIVLGKVTSDFRGVHVYLYRQQLTRCTVHDSRLINSQTPHKMFRRSFLAEHDLRYEEGPRRLEDQLFVTRAYLAARSCAVVADYVCYRYLRQPDGGNIGSRMYDPADYFANLAAVLDAVDGATSPGPDRDRLYRRFLRVEMLGKLSGRRVLERPRPFGENVLTQVRNLLAERFPLAVDEGLWGVARLRAHLARQGSYDDFVALAGRSRLIQPAARIRSMGWPRPGVVELEVSGQLLYDGAPLALEADGTGWLLPARVVGPGVAAGLRRVEPTEEIMIDGVVRSRELGDEWFLQPLAVFVEPGPDGGRLRFEGRVRLEVATSAGGGPLAAGAHEISVRMNGLGLHRLRPLRPTVARPEPTATVFDTEPVATLTSTRSGRTMVRIGGSQKTTRRRRGPAAASWLDGRLVVALATGWASPAPVTMLTATDGTTIRVPLGRDDDLGKAWSSARHAVPPGTYAVRVRLGRSGSLAVEDRLVVPRSLDRTMTLLARRGRRLLRRAAG